MHCVNWRSAQGAAAATALLCTMASTSNAQPAGATLVVADGQTIVSALREQNLRERAGSLHNQWLQAGHQDSASSTAAPPAVTGGTVITSTLEVGNPNSFPAISFSFTSGKPGFEEADFYFTSPNGNQTLTSIYVPGPYLQAGTVNFSFPFSLPRLYAQPGTWTLTTIIAVDRAGTVTKYAAPAIAAMFNNVNFTMINTGPYDATPPVIVKGKLLTQTVSLSAPNPLFKTVFTATDYGSGLYQAYTAISPPGQNYAYTNPVPLPFPARHAVMAGNVHFYPGQTTGTYTIHSYAVCDVALNCTASKSSADVQAMFGATTFTVTP